ncbi:hypothetical protein Dda_8904 [Drechslerella dactyloides]|uniref:Nucleoside phosphorylase domain-containing protein n=1 Tax=Drechslerella dactyloides TaxID=74499 RepID=A0AAD6NFP0_DREDA|nr:hypothetical protein Dda_8904 [Drechslerella dactyloides]
MVRLRKAEYNVGWLCALDCEAAAALLMLDAQHDTPLDYARPQTYAYHSLSASQNDYRFGSIGGHNVVIAALPTGSTGTTAAADVAHDFNGDFPNLQFRFMVGIGGGVPGDNNSGSRDIRVGDVVVSVPDGGSAGVVQHDRGRRMAGYFDRVGVLPPPPQNLLRALTFLRGVDERTIGKMMAETLWRACAAHHEERFERPRASTDLLFDAGYGHVSSSTGKGCTGCDRGKLKLRSIREYDYKIRVHFGTIASGNSVMRDGITRDSIAQETGALCFEMEAAGIMGAWPCLVVRGISDYCDSHKNDDWRWYAAGTAAAFTKFMLLEMSGGGSHQPSNEDANIMNNGVDATTATVSRASTFGARPHAPLSDLAPRPPGEPDLFAAFRLPRTPSSPTGYQANTPTSSPPSRVPTGEYPPWVPSSVRQTETFACMFGDQDPNDGWRGGSNPNSTADSSTPRRSMSGGASTADGSWGGRTGSMGGNIHIGGSVTTHGGSTFVGNNTFNSTGDMRFG